MCGMSSVGQVKHYRFWTSLAGSLLASTSNVMDRLDGTREDVWKGVSEVCMVCKVSRAIWHVNAGDGHGEDDLVLTCVRLNLYRNESDVSFDL